MGFLVSGSEQGAGFDVVGSRRDDVVERLDQVIAPGGGQLVEWTETGVYLTGWAEVLCQGEWLRAPPISAATAFPSGS